MLLFGVLGGGAVEGEGAGVPPFDVVGGTDGPLGDDVDGEVDVVDKVAVLWDWILAAVVEVGGATDVGACVDRSTVFWRTAKICSLRSLFPSSVLR